MDASHPERPMPTDLAAQIDIVMRLVAAAVLGGVVGLERELHNHPAGMRTHLLVALGSGAFTVLSMVGFGGVDAATGQARTDPARVAAQVVSGIGFLGAGAILKYGTTIKGLTTAGSLWATAAIGMAAGAGAWLIAAASTVLAVASLWPLQVVVERARLRRGRLVQVSFGMARLAPLGALTSEAARRRIEVVEIHTHWDGDYIVDMQLRLPAGAVEAEVIEGLSSIEGAQLREASRYEESPG
jgi:putative Mg2+ transporter-C (MgtC) family protein